MKNMKKKLALSLLVMSCASVCVGAGIATNDYVAQGVTANADAEYPTYTISKLGGLGGSNASALYAYAMEGATSCLGDAGWTSVFTLESGAGFALNGEAFTPAEFKQPGNDLYIVLGREAAVGDVLTIDGTFVNTTAGVKMVFNNCALKFNGTAWQTEVVYTTYTVNAIAPATTSNTASTLYASITDGSVGVEHWERPYTFEAGTGTGFTLGGAAVEGFELKYVPGSNFYIALHKDAQAGESLVIDGTFYNEALGSKIVFNNCILTFNGTEWEAYRAPATVFNVAAIAPTANGNTANSFYAYVVNGDTLTLNNWDEKFTLKSGNGFTLNGEAVASWEMKQPGADLYLVVNGEINEGDRLVIGGTFYNEALNVEIVIADTEFVWNGTAWEVYTAPVEYTTYNISSVTLTNGSPNLIEAYPTVESEKPTANSWTHVFAFVEGTGAGFCLNGETLASATIKQPNDFYIELGAVTFAKDDIITIDGTFVNEEKAMKIVFTNCQFQFNGTAWEVYTAPVEYTTENVGAFALHGNSIGVGGAAQSNNVVYLKRADEGEFTVLDWSAPFAYESGEGFKINGESANFIKMFSTSDGFYVEFEALEAGDVVSIGGTFACETKATKYVIEESKFTWTGSGWEAYKEPVAPSTFTVNKIAPTANGNTQNSFNAYVVDGDALTLNNWDEKFTLKEGTGFTLNGEAVASWEMKQPGADLYLVVNGPINEGDKLVIGGTFYNEALNATIIIADTEFVWNGTAWEVYTAPVEYTTYTIEKLGVLGSSSATHIDAYALEGATPGLGDAGWGAPFVYESGEGFKWNGEAFTPEMKQPGTDLYINLGREATEGDILTVSGTFVNEALAIKIVINEGKLQFTNGAWGVYREAATVYTLNAIAPIANELNTANSFYAYVTDGDTLAVNNWLEAFSLKAGNGFTVNGQAVASWEMKQPGADLYLVVNGEINEGDKLVIGGTFYNEALNVEIVIADTEFTWNGTAWVTYAEPVEPVDPIVYNLNVILPNSAHNTANAFFASVLDGDMLRGGENFGADESWQYPFLLKEGAGFTLNGQAVGSWELKQPGTDLYIVVNGEINEGDKLAISGSFYSQGYNTIINIENNEFVWNGSAWVLDVEYEEVEIGTLAVNWASNTVTENSAPNATQLYLKRADGQELPVENWNVLFTLESGAGVTSVNGSVALNEMKSTDAGLFLGLAGVEVGTRVTISGTFVCESLGYKYIIEETEFVWTGNIWTIYSELVTYEVNAIASTVNNNTANAFFAYVADGDPLTVDSWDFAFTLKEGLGFTLNGNAVDSWEMKQPGADLYIAVNGAIAEGDILVIGGTFYNETLNVEIVIAESTFIYTESDGWIINKMFVIAEAKNELDAYKNEADYKAEQWTEIQGIIDGAVVKMNETDGNAAAISAIVAEAKAAIDAVKTATQVEAEALAALREAAINELMAYYEAINYDAYSDEANAEISGYVATAEDAINAATTKEAMDAAIATCKASIEAVEKLPTADTPADDSTSDTTSTDAPTEEKKGCMSVVGSGLAVSVTALAAAAVVTLGKKKED